MGIVGKTYLLKFLEVFRGISDFLRFLRNQGYISQPFILEWIDVSSKLHIILYARFASVSAGIIFTSL